MLTDMIVEEEFEKDEESWYGKQDLEHDLQLAAQLGKTLLDRNHELEQALKQMYATNDEQLQEIEYLTKQVDLLRQMNDQHAKMYEQLDLAARDLEQSNHRLGQDNRLAQHKINSLTETVDGLQAHMEDLHAQVEDLREAQVERTKRQQVEQRRTLGAQSVSCLKELYDLHQDRYDGFEGWHADWPWSHRGSFSSRENRGYDPEEAQATLRHSIRTLQSQVAAERSRRETAERETEQTAREHSALEQQLAQLEGCRGRQRELEAEVEELRLLWRSECASSRGLDRMLPDTIFFSLGEEKPSQLKSEERGREEEEDVPERGRLGRLRCNSEGFLRSAHMEEVRRGHEQMCIRRAEAVKQRGVSLLNEVDAQYSALKVKYEELLRRCQQGADGLINKAVQTPSSPQVGTCVSPAGQQAEYKVLFKEIFSRIRKTKEDLSENRRADPGQPL